jgi:hypothetical protein
VFDDEGKEDVEAHLGGDDLADLEEAFVALQLLLRFTDGHFCPRAKDQTYRSRFYGLTLEKSI